MASKRHPDMLELLQYAESQVDPSLATPATASVQEHLSAGCERCSTELRSWVRTLTALTADRAPAPPANVVRCAVALFDQVERAPTVWERIAALLVWDSRVQPALVGVRDVGVRSYRLQFEAGEARVDLLCAAEGSSWRLAGQVAAGDAEAGPWTVAVAGTDHETRTDAFGEFHLSGLAPGSYELTLRGAGTEIALPPVELPSL